MALGIEIDQLRHCSAPTSSATTHLHKCLPRLQLPHLQRGLGNSAAAKEQLSTIKSTCQMGSPTLTCHIGGSLKTMSTNMNPSGRMHSRQDASGTILNHAEAMRSPLCAASRCVNSMKSIWFNIEPLPELLQCDRSGEANWKGNGMLMTNMAY
jgi:hypothetical protein